MYDGERYWFVSFILMAFACGQRIPNDMRQIRLP